VSHHATTSRPRPPARAFTLVELLMVVVIILILAGVLLTAVFGVIKGSKSANIEAQLNSIAQGVEAFNLDFNAYPPLLTHLAESSLDVLTPELNGGSDRAAVRDGYFDHDPQFASEWSLPVFLLGVGDLDGDREVSAEGDDGKEGPGIRAPGPSRAWKSPTGEHRAARSGRVYGPYLEFGAMDKYLRRVVVERGPGGFIQRAANQTDPDAQALFALVDVYGVPVRYYRNWPDRRPPGAGDLAGKPSSFYAPLCLRTPESVEAQFDNELNPTEDVITDRYLTTAPFMLLSAGEELERTVDADGNAIPGFGDRLVDADGDVQLVGRANDGATTGMPSDAQFTRVLKLLESNVRYAP
jgi:prepilin-type N-terminal cleavage/methylation domain-containing protein